MIRFLVIALAFISFSSHAQNFTFGEAFPGITFTAPVEMLTPPDDSKRIFIVQQNGIIKVFENKVGILPGEVKTFLDISPQIISGGERGLLGMAFHPNYKTNGYFYLNYTRSNPLTSVISRFSVKAGNPTEADPTSELVLLTQAQPYDNHNGGKLSFGTDGFLYVSIGDGGSGGDPQNYAQNLTTLLGKILRIDVDQTEGILFYSIPNSNLFKNNTDGYRPEIFAYGLRNVWKFSIDMTNGQLWAADVGQGAREEINLLVNGGNYGWRLMEGTLCYNPATNCNSGNLILPIFEYPHTNSNQSITGGYVYRGVQIPEWNGHYIYGDYVSGRIWKLAYENNQASNEFLLLSGGLISSFGEDHNREPHVIRYSTGNSGKIFRFFPAAPIAPSGVRLTNLQGTNKLEWIDQSNNELAFIIERSIMGENNFLVLDTVAYNIEMYVDELGADSTPYTYRIKAYNDGGESEYANVGDIIVSASDLLFDNVKIYPNPVTDKITIELPVFSGESKIRIFNFLRQEIFVARTTDKEIEIDFSDYSSGIYLIEVTSQQGSAVRKICVQ